MKHMELRFPANPFGRKRRQFQARLPHPGATHRVFAVNHRNRRRQSLRVNGVEATANDLHTPLRLRSATDLLVQVTQLQYHFKDSRPVYALVPHEDWAHLLRHSRQLFGYRLVINFLFPSPERHQLREVPGLLKRKAGLTGHSELMPEDMAQQCAVALFGLTEDEAKVKHYIDTVRNLIQLSDKLESLPAVVCTRVRRFLKANPGILPSSTSAKTAILLVNKPANKLS